MKLKWTLGASTMLLAGSLIVPSGTIFAATTSGNSTSHHLIQAGSHANMGRTQNVGSDLALGKSYTVTTQWPDNTFHSIESKWPNNGQLTDGQMAPLSFSSSGWEAFLRQYGRAITINLGKTENIRSLSLNMLQNLSAGIDFPNSVSYQVSNDGKHWTSVGMSKSTWKGDTTPGTQAYRVYTNVNARYVRAIFTAKVFAFADEFVVDGFKTPNWHTWTPQFGHAQPWSTKSVGYLPSGSWKSAGIRNLMLAYTDGHGSLGTWTAQNFEPMIAHETSSGKATNWMYDGVLFGPYGSPASASTINGWVQNLFSKDIQLSALNQAVATAKKKLNDPGYKEKVVINVPGLTSSPSSFGAISPSGRSLDLNPADVGQYQAYLNKLKVIHWYIHQIEQNWKSHHYSNLELAGFYWQPESLAANLPYNADLVRATSFMVHLNGGKFFWIPYYGAVGVTRARSLGFDSVMIQPNVSFNWNINAYDRFASVAGMAKQYGDGIEIEAHWDVTSATTSLAQTAQKKYYDYFSAGNVFGFQNNVLKSYYLGSKTLLTAYQSTNPFYHSLYDNTNRFIEGLWTGTQIQ
ncbi:DUF4855 domain-containing protein [Alicyclobacillus sp. SO9]|uniref:DUF4855 domain-containing protein n=1 Tax=Alicyclobacillus sp. SO9 TaxID=2665646 RepID=UPI0018E8E61A|nr:DUF4855 domain-containing protein [Alicyclobacillus sp. SO9]QQE80540.1 DUF4855 domain-containing protein [Alicyclobacillus sp. SO9]